MKRSNHKITKLSPLLFNYKVVKNIKPSLQEGKFYFGKKPEKPLCKIIKIEI